ncbi:hypothetical protein [Francisella sp. LA112445]|uniref:hypothetical protein n=1 Tax=Francisella sp. LA112445 TaxID=1395624 RepID=UPI001788B97A|nr:hypothetical protein [Francisella sp. LA112445]QIW09416.1 hypothetical protein FIP56_01440 [Francisella sp. LA112445]
MCEKDIKSLFIRKFHCMGDEYFEKYKEVRCYLDPNFIKHLEQESEVESRRWELLLVYKLIKQGFNVIKSVNSKGPDFHLKVNDKNLWIEAVSPNKGNGVDKVPDISQEFKSCEDLKCKKIKSHWYQPNKMQLRLTSVLNDKLLKIQGYINECIVNENDMVIIAINTFCLDNPTSHDEIPEIIKVLKGLGEEYFIIDSASNKVIDQGIESESQILKSNGAIVSKGIFNGDKKYNCISAVLYSETPISSDYLLIKNPFAKTPILSSFFDVWKSLRIF